MSGHEGLDGTDPAAERPRVGDRLYGPGDLDPDGASATDQGDEGRRHPRVVLLTRKELEEKRLRIHEQLTLWDELPSRAELEEELGDINWLLGDDGGG